MNSGKLLRNLLGASALVTASVTGTYAFADSVVLNANDGSISARGEYVGFENGDYIIKTPLGELVFSSDTVTCEGAACPDLTVAAPAVVADVVLKGSGAMGDGLMPLMLAGYAVDLGASMDVATDEHGSSVYTLVGDGGFGDDIGSYEVEPSTSDDAFSTLLSKEGDIGMSTRRITRDEARALAKDGSGLMTDISQEHIIAVDNLTVIVNQENPVKSLSMGQLAGIYKGEITNWSELGGPDMPIVVYDHAESSNSRRDFDNRVLPGGNTVAGAQIIEGEGANNTIASDVNTDPAAIGYVGYAYVNGAKPLNLVSECGITSVPNAFSTKTEEYPLGRRLYVYNRGDNLSAPAGNFINYAISASADSIIDKAGFINLGVERLTQDNAQARMRDLINNTTDKFELDLMRQLLVEMFQWDRLSTTFRFAAGSNNLDRKSVLDLARLVDYLSVAPEGTEVALVGFTDSDGAFGANTSLSQRRANQVIKAINDFAGDELSHIKFVPLGFGELSPAACNSDGLGKAINRRVEVWIRSNS